MLSPDYLDHAPDTLITLIQQLEDDILQDVGRRIGKMGEVTDTAQWQLWRLDQLQGLQEDVIRKLSQYSGKTAEEIRTLLQDAGTKALSTDDEIYRAVGLNPEPFQESTQLTNLLNAGYRQTMGTWKNLTATTANTVTGQFERALDVTWSQIASGAFDYKTAIKRAVDNLALHMDGVTYPSGHRDTLEVAVRRAALTGINQTAAQLQLQRMEDVGCEFVEVTAHPGARPEHAIWQGKVYHTGGAVWYEGVYYEDFETATGYGTGPGLCGWNCRHNFFPFFPGLSERAYPDEKLREYENDTVEFNGKTYTRYEASQMQRALERKVRKYKQQYLAEDAAGLDSAQSAVKLKTAREQLKQFAYETGLDLDSARIAVNGFGRSAASKATAAAMPFASFRKNNRAAIVSELLPNYHRAIIPNTKLSGYVLNLNHPTGGPKAVAFRDVLGYTVENEADLIAELQKGLAKWKATIRPETKYGQTFEVKMLITGPTGRTATVKTGWIVDTGSDVPRLTSAYIYDGEK